MKQFRLLHCSETNLIQYNNLPFILSTLTGETATGMGPPPPPPPCSPESSTSSKKKKKKYERLFLHTYETEF
jgi:hypothetical protein